MQFYTQVETEEIGVPSASTDVSATSGSVSAGRARIIRQPVFIFLVLLLLSLPIRLVHLQAPIWGEHEFRQAQTALSVWDIREHGISWLHPKLPLFGPPWECPLEYPVFQLVAAAIDSIAPWHNLDTSIRVTSLVFFYLASVALYLLARQLFERPAIALLASAVFVFSPYNLFWSQALTIEYAAGFFALSYVLCLVRWTLKPGWLLFFLTLLFGTLGSLTKITTFAWPLFVAGSLGGLHVWDAIKARRDFLHESPFPAVTSPVTRVLLFACLLGFPLAIGCLYVRFSDQIKAESPYTAWLCSNSAYIKHWNFGTLTERFSRLTWKVILNRIVDTVQSTPAVILFVGLLALPFKTRMFKALRYGNFWMGLSLALAPFAVMLVFFKLYMIHTYYWIAVAPLLALAAGVGMDSAFNLVTRPYFKFLLLLAFSGVWLNDLARRTGTMLAPASPDRRVIYLSRAADRIPKDDPVIIVSQWEWSPFAPYYLKHRAFMALFIDKPVDTRPLVETDYFKQNGFHWLLVDGKSSQVQAMVAGITNRWKFAQLIPGPNKAYKLYSLSDRQDQHANGLITGQVATR